MGEVYRARDTQLKREVAIKILPEAVAADPDRVARFQREAEVLATLNHPSIAAVYGLEQRALVLELVEGETLADVIARGAISVPEALAIARQIIDALENAHDKGIVHRDLKPANIKITPDTKVKVLDFGLAKALDVSGGSGRPGGSGGPGGFSVSPTLSVHATLAGVILGTAAYMSPEQARGKAVDRRADIWAFGCVLFEMLTGKPAFNGDSITDIVSAITRDEVNWASLPADTPPHVTALLRRCLQKDPQKRLPHIGVARLDLDETNLSQVAQGFSPADGLRPPRVLLPWIVAAASASAFAGALSIWAPWRSVAARDTIQLAAGIGADASLVTGPGPAAIVSPDGRWLAFSAARTNDAPQLYVRRLDHLNANPLDGTADARSPFFSPDGQWIAFFADGKLKKVSTAGGAVVTLSDAPGGRGGDWAADGTIVFQPSNTGTGPNMGATLLAVPATGGETRVVTVRQEEEANERWPQVLPGGRAILYTAPRAAGNYTDSRINVQQIATHERKTLVRGGYFARYVPSGHLLFLRDSTMFAVPFDLQRLEVVGDAVPVVEHVASDTTLGSAQFSVSDTGTLVYATGEDLHRSIPIVWLDENGRSTPLRSTPADWSNLTFSPDGRRLAMDIASPQTDIWTYDIERDSVQRLTFDGAAHWTPVWTPDGRRIVFRAVTAGAFNLFWVRADGSTPPERLTNGDMPQAPGSWHPSGRYLAFTQTNPKTNDDLMILPIEGDEASGWKLGTPRPFANEPFSESEPMFSPDGRWIAYFSAETGRQEIFVRPFPGPGGKWQISTGGGLHPTWSRTRNQLYFTDLGQRIQVVNYRINGDSFEADRARGWSNAQLAFRDRGVSGVTGRNLSVAPDGSRLAVGLAPAATLNRDHVVVVVNFFDELRRLAPVRK